MNEETADDVRRIVDDLDNRISRDDAIVQFDMYGGTPDESKVQANQNGYLRLGIEFLKAAFAPPAEDAGKNPEIIDVNIDYLTSRKSAIRFDWFERTEELKPCTYRHSATRDRLALVGCALAVFAIAMVAIGGVLFWCGYSLNES